MHIYIEQFQNKYIMQQIRQMYKHIPELLRNNVSGDVKALGSVVVAPDGNPHKPNPEEIPNKKVKPLSKQLVSKLQGCSQRLTEIMSWHSKLDGSALNLAPYNSF